MSIRTWIDETLRRRSHYRATFKPGASTDAVLADLRRFCRFGETPIAVSAVMQQVDPIATAKNIGRAEVFSRIVHFLHIDDSQLLKMKEQADDDD